MGRPGPSTIRDGQLHQLASVRKRGLGCLQARHHSCQFDSSICLSDMDNATGCDLSVAGLDHDVVLVCKCGDLGQVSDHDDLSVVGQARQSTTDLYRDPAAHTGVNLVE